ncbi:hypothetical protein OIU84_017600, partial [Salix udensis]
MADRSTRLPSVVGRQICQMGCLGGHGKGRRRRRGVGHRRLERTDDGKGRVAAGEGEGRGGSLWRVGKVFEDCHEPEIV